MRQDLTAPEDQPRRNQLESAEKKNNPRILVALAVLLVGVAIVFYLNLRSESGPPSEVQEILKQIDENPPPIQPEPQGEPLPAFGGRR